MLCEVDGEGGGYVVCGYYSEKVSTQKTCPYYEVEGDLDARWPF